MRRLNRAWRGKDRPTDVLSFPAGGPGALLGDIVISLDTARRAAKEEGRGVGAELDRYLAHGLLHLLGHDHERPADARRMAEAEDALVGEGMVRAAHASPPLPEGKRTPPPLPQVGVVVGAILSPDGERAGVRAVGVGVAGLARPPPPSGRRGGGLG